MILLASRKVERLELFQAKLTVLLKLEPAVQA